MSDTYNPLAFLSAPGDAWSGNYAPVPYTRGTLTEDDAYRQNYARDREVMDAINLGWFGPRGGSNLARLAVDYAPSRLAGNNKTEREGIFKNETGVMSETSHSPFRNALSNLFGTPAKREERRNRPAQQLFTDPATGERYQTWPEKVARSASTLAGDVAAGGLGGLGTLGLRREDLTDIPPDQSGPIEGGIPGLGTAFNAMGITSRGGDQPGDELMERAQDLAGIMGGGPLTQPANRATLASGAQRPPGGPMPSRRSLFTLNKTPEVPVAEPRAPLDVGQNAPAPQLPAVRDPLANLLQGPGEAPASNNLLKQLTEPPAAAEPQGISKALQAAANVPLDRRELIRGAGAVATNASRLGRAAEALTSKAPEAIAAPKEVLPKFEEIWKKGVAGDAHITPEIYKNIEEDFLDSNDYSSRRAAIKDMGSKDEYERALADHYNSADDMEEWFPNSTRYSDFQLPGGDNYRELLVKHSGVKGEELQPIFDKINKKLGLIDDGPGIPKWKHKVSADTFKMPSINWDHNLYQWERDGVISKKDELLLRSKLNELENGGFTSSSWDEPNVIGALRMHDRNIPGVGKSLHLEELNSEWHQEGQGNGYESDFDRIKSEGEDALRHKKTGIVLFRNEMNKHVPDAPLKTTWPDYLLRRAIREAVEQGHDAVSWTPGEHQVKRMGSWQSGDETDPVSNSVRDFYDKHLVDRANVIGKEYGTKVEQRDTGGYYNKHGTDDEIQYKVPTLKITSQLRKAVKDGTFSLLSDSGKPGAPLAALEKGAQRSNLVKLESIIGNKPRIHYTDADGYTATIVHDPKNDVNGLMKGRSYITNPQGDVFERGNWADYPDKGVIHNGVDLYKDYYRKPTKAEKLRNSTFDDWVKNETAYGKMSVKERMELEAKRQATAYAPLKDQWQELINHNKQYPGAYKLYSDSGKPGAPLAGLEKGAAKRYLVPAYKYKDGKIWKGEIGDDHENIFGEDISRDTDFTRGFVNHKGQFLTGDRAAQYALKEGLVHPSVEELVRKHPGMLTADFLMSDSGKPGAPLAALERTAPKDPAEAALRSIREALAAHPDAYEQSSPSQERRNAPSVDEARAMAKELINATGERWENFTSAQRREWLRRGYDQIVRNRERNAAYEQTQPVTANTTTPASRGGTVEPRPTEGWTARRNAEHGHNDWSVFDQNGNLVNTSRIDASIKSADAAIKRAASMRGGRYTDEGMAAQQRAERSGPLGGLPGARAAFDEHIGKYIPEEEFRDKFFGGMHSPNIKMGVTSRGVLKFDGPLRQGGRDIGAITRELDMKNGIAHHGYLNLDYSKQGSGIAKSLLANQVELYHRLGMNSVETYADIDVGSYAWAKYGFLPDEAAWSRTADKAKRRLQQHEASGDIDPRDARVVQKILDTKDPRAIWDLVDSQLKLRGGDSVAKNLLFDNGWDAHLDLYDQDSMSRFHSYVKKGKK